MSNAQDTVYTGAIEDISHDAIIFDPSGDIMRKKNEQYPSNTWLTLKYKKGRYQWVNHNSIYSVKPVIGSDIKHISTLSYTEESIKLENGQETKYLIIYYCNNPGDLHLKTRTFGIQDSNEWLATRWMADWAHMAGSIVDKYSVSKNLTEIPIYQPDICTNPLHYDPYEIISPTAAIPETVSPWHTDDMFVNNAEEFHQDTITDTTETTDDDLVSQLNEYEGKQDEGKQDEGKQDEGKQDEGKQDEGEKEEIDLSHPDNIHSEIDLQQKFEEYRIDPYNGDWYTESEFKEYYGGCQEWDFQEPKKILIREELKELAWDFRELHNRNFKTLLDAYKGTF